MLVGAALDIIEEQPKIEENPYVFAGTPAVQPSLPDDAQHKPTRFNSWSQRKAELSKKLPSDMPHWTVHDLRPTARSLLARVGVNRDVAEHLIGHAIPGVEGIYNRYDYYEEKTTALTSLEIELNKIVAQNDSGRNAFCFPNLRKNDG